MVQNTTFRECCRQGKNFILFQVKDNISDRFRKRLRQLRIQRGWTQEKASEVCGIGHKVFQLYELGIKANPGLLTLEKIAQGFGIDVHDLLAPSFPSKPLSNSPGVKQGCANKTPLAMKSTSNPTS
jgi:DNA-binding XRE family transcriptional regulator